MEYRYKLTGALRAEAARFCEFRNGGAQVTIKLSNGKVYKEALISNSMAIIALRGHEQLPFEVAEISSIYQTEEDKHPKDTSGWVYWDKWH